MFLSPETSRRSVSAHDWWTLRAYLTLGSDGFTHNWWTFAAFVGCRGVLLRMIGGHRCFWDGEIRRLRGRRSIRAKSHKTNIRVDYSIYRLCHLSCVDKALLDHRSCVDGCKKSQLIMRRVVAIATNYAPTTSDIVMTTNHAWKTMMQEIAYGQLVHRSCAT